MRSLEQLFSHLRTRIAICSFLFSVTIMSACGEQPWKGIEIDPPRAIPEFTFLTSTGEKFSTAPVTGKPMLLFFGYTHCPDVCPMTLADWTRVKKALGTKAENVRWVFVSVDPDRDTPEVAERYSSQFDKDFIGVSGDSATTADIQTAFSAASYQTPGVDEDSYLVTHASQVFLVDDEGMLRAMYAFNSGHEAIATDLERLLH